VRLTSHTEEKRTKYLGWQFESTLAGYEQPLVVPQDGQAWQLPDRSICTPHWKQ
jgi:hypothetical protein